jgi:hypothetical protein
VLCRTWDRDDVCAPGGNPLAVAAAHAVLHAFGAEADARHGEAAPLVTLLTREDTARRGKGRGGKGRGGRHRVLRNSAALVATIARACPPVRVETSGLASLSFAAQLALMRRTAVPRATLDSRRLRPTPNQIRRPTPSQIQQTPPRAQTAGPKAALTLALAIAPSQPLTLSRCLSDRTAQG